MIKNVDIVIIGGGIAGLWTLHRLKQQGYQAILLEADSLGGGQTIRSQGIIHGGLKYALSGNLNSATNALSDMPTYWQSCLAGNGEVNLSGVEVLATGQHMWSISALTGGISTLFASSALKSQVQTIARDSWPAALAASAIKSKLYRLEELVLNIPTVIKALVSPYIDSCIKIDAAEQYKLDIDEQNNIRSLTVKINQHEICFTAKTYIFTAGSGNENLIKFLSSPPAMQRRPLHMVLVKSTSLSPLFGHCIGLGTTPRVTITTHTAKDGSPVWYLGGKLAEEGVTLSPAQQIDVAKQELATLFPNLNLQTAHWASFYIDRAEAKQADGSKPSGTTIFAQNNFITAWPTKLALAPVLTAEILDILKKQNIKPTTDEINAQSFTAPNIATPIWDKLL